MQKAIAMLDEVKESIINAYEIKTGMSRTKLSHLMDAETWMDAHTAIDMGFADEILTRPAEIPVENNIAGGGRVTIYTCDKETLLGLILISSVLHYIDHRLQVGFGVFGIGGLCRIFGIVDWMVEPATHIPYLADRHYDDLRGSRYLLRMSI